MTRGVLFIGVLLAAQTAFSQDTTWTGGASGTFGVSANWSSGVPSASLGAMVERNTAIVLSGSNVAESLEVGGNSAVTMGFLLSSSLTINGGNVLVDAGSSLEIAGAGILAVGGVNGITGSGTLNFASGEILVSGADLTSDIAINLVADPSLPSAIDTGGFNATLSGNITAASAGQFGSGGNGLFKLNTGTLFLSGSSRAFGTFDAGGGVTDQTAGSTLATEFMVASGAGVAANYVLDSGSLTIHDTVGTSGPTPGSLRVGDFQGTGTFVQNGGAVTVTGTSALTVGNQGGNGVYNLKSGTLTIAGGNSSLARSDTNSPAGSGTLNIAGGLLQIQNASTLIVGNNLNTTGTAVLNQSSGTLSVANDSQLAVGGLGSGTYNLTGGVLQIGGSSFKAQYNTSGSPYGFNFGGGTIAVTGSDLATSVNTTLLSGRNSLIDTKGLNATFSGAITGTNSQLIKTGLGNLAFTGGSDEVDSFLIAGGNFNHSVGETLTSYEVAVGSGSGALGSYTMTGGTLTLATGTPSSIVGGAASSFRIGDFGGTGTFNQSGGVVTVNGAMNLGNQGGHGIYNLSGGVLNLAAGQSDFGRTSGSSAALGGSSGMMNLSGSGTLQLSGTAMLVLGNWYPSSGLLQGSGTLSQTGGLVSVANTATLYLSGEGTGVYNLFGGTLQVGGSSLQPIFGQSGTYAFNLGGGTVQVSGTDLGASVNAVLAAGSTSTIDTQDLNATWSGVISGSGGLQKLGAGTLTLAGNNTYTGNTVISSGTVQVGAGGTQGSLAGNVQNSGVLAFARSDTLAYSGTISGSGEVRQTGTGTTVLTGANVYTGTTTITNGTLQLGNGGTSGSISGNVSNSGTLAFDRSNTVTFGGTISGSGQVQQLGTGTTILTAANDYTGNTVVRGGALFINNSTGSGVGSGNVDVQSGGLLGGTGAAGGLVTIESGGTLAPGSMTFQSNGLALADHSTIMMREGTISDLIGDTGGLSIGKNISVVLASGAGLGVGVYYLIDFSGPLVDNSSNFEGWTLTGLPGAYVSTFAVDDPDHPSAIELKVSTLPVPEPDGVPLFALGLLAAAVVRIRKNRMALRQGRFGGD